MSRKRRSGGPVPRVRSCWSSVCYFRFTVGRQLFTVISPLFHCFEQKHTVKALCDGDSHL